MLSSCLATGGPWRLLFHHVSAGRRFQCRHGRLTQRWKLHTEWGTPRWPCRMSSRLWKGRLWVERHQSTKVPSENPEGSALIWAAKVIMAVVHFYIFHGGFLFVHEWASAHIPHDIPYVKRTGRCMQTCHICSACQHFFHLWANSSEHMHSCIGDPKYIQTVHPPQNSTTCSARRPQLCHLHHRPQVGSVERPSRFQFQLFNYRAGLTGQSYRDSAVTLLCWIYMMEQITEMTKPRGRAVLLLAHVLPTEKETNFSS